MTCMHTHPVIYFVCKKLDDGVPQGYPAAGIEVRTAVPLPRPGVIIQ
jgi:hypothetical protein